MKLPKLKFNIKNQNLKPKFSLKATERDKKLLAVLGVLLLIVLSYYLLYRPLHAVSQKLHTEKTKMDARVKQAKSDLANESIISQEYEAALARTNKSTVGYFPKVYPYKDRYLVMLENIVKNSGAAALKITFDDPEVGAVPLLDPNKDQRLKLPGYPLLSLAQKINLAAQQENKPGTDNFKFTEAIKAEEKKKPDAKTLPADAVLRLPATLEVQGSYAQIKAVITNLENLNRKLALEGVIIEKDKDGNYQKASLSMAFYAVEKVDKAADPFNAWTIQGSYGKVDLFN